MSPRRWDSSHNEFVSPVPPASSCMHDGTLPSLSLSPGLPVTLIHQLSLDLSPTWSRSPNPQSGQVPAELVHRMYLTPFLQGLHCLGGAATSRFTLMLVPSEPFTLVTES